MDIETIFPETNTRGTAFGRIVVKEIRKDVTIDFEEFEMLYITVVVWDDNTVDGIDYDECKYFLSFVIIIINLFVCTS